MKKLLIIALVIAVLVAAAGAYLVLTTPKSGAGVRFPLTPAHRALVASVPASAEAFALVPTAAVLDAKLRANPASREAVERWTAGQRLPKPWMVGGADVLAWRSGKQTRYLVQLDPLRATLVRIYLMISGDSGGTLVMSAPDEPLIPRDELDRLLALAQPLPQGDVFAVQRQGSRGAFPPIGRPAVSTASVTPSEILVTSRAAAPPDAPSRALQPRYPRGALLTAVFATPPRSLDDLNRLVRTRVSKLLEEGGGIALYEIDTGKLLPRPKEVIILPATDERRAALQKFISDVAPPSLTETVGFRVETADTGSDLLVAFERPTIEQYLKDTFVPATLPATSWALRVDPGRTAPVLQQVLDSPGLRYATPRLFRSARDLSGWIDDLRDAEAIEAGATVKDGVEELRVRVTAAP